MCIKNVDIFVRSTICGKDVSYCGLVMVCFCFIGFVERCLSLFANTKVIVAITCWVEKRNVGINEVYRTTGFEVQIEPVDVFVSIRMQSSRRGFWKCCQHHFDVNAKRFQSTYQFCFQSQQMT